MIIYKTSRTARMLRKCLLTQGTRVGGDNCRGIGTRPVTASVIFRFNRSQLSSPCSWIHRRLLPVNMTSTLRKFRATSCWSAGCKSHGHTLSEYSISCIPHLFGKLHSRIARVSPIYHNIGSENTTSSPLDGFVSIYNDTAPSSIDIYRTLVTSPPS